MGRMAHGFRLVGASWQVLRTDKELMLLPLLSFLSILTFGIPIGLGVWGAGIPEDPSQMSAFQWFLLAAFYFASSFFAVFFNAAIVGAATIRLQGGDPTVRDGLRLAFEKIDKIVGWALLTATVGLLLRSLEERAGLLGRFVISLVGAAWSVVTFFVVPVLLFEPEGVTGSVKRSASLFRQRWGEQLVGSAGIGLVMFLLTIPVLLVSFALAQIAVPLAILFAVVGIGILTTAGSAMSGIFNAALYRFAVTGETTGSFTPGDFEGAFRPRRRTF